MLAYDIKRTSETTFELYDKVTGEKVNIAQKLKDSFHAGHIKKK
jgi:hypothetical protein